MSIRTAGIPTVDDSDIPTSIGATILTWSVLFLVIILIAKLLSEGRTYSPREKCRDMAYSQGLNDFDEANGNCYAVVNGKIKRIGKI